MFCSFIVYFIDKLKHAGHLQLGYCNTLLQRIRGAINLSLLKLQYVFGDNFHLGFSVNVLNWRTAGDHLPSISGTICMLQAEISLLKEG